MSHQYGDRLHALERELGDRLGVEVLRATMAEGAAASLDDLRRRARDELRSRARLGYRGRSSGPRQRAVMAL